MYAKLISYFGYHPKAKKVVITCAIISVIMSMCAVMSFADPANTDISEVTTGITSIFSNLTSTFNFTTIISILGIAIGAAALLYLAWWGLRKIVRMMTSALKGRLNVG